MNMTTLEKMAVARGREQRAELVGKRLLGEAVSNLDYYTAMGKVGEGEEIPEAEWAVCGVDIREARTHYGGYASDSYYGQTTTQIQRLTDKQLYTLWRIWVARERRVVGTSTFAGWLGGTER